MMFVGATGNRSEVTVEDQLLLRVRTTRAGNSMYRPFQSV